MARRLLVAVMVLVVAVAANAEVAVRVVARNPSASETQEFVVRYFLPKGITREDVLDDAGMTIVYDEQQELFLARRTVELEPGQTVEYEIKLRDIWLIEPEVLQGFKTRARQGVDKLQGEAYATHGNVLLARINTMVDLMVSRQDEARVPEASIPDHISAFDRNQDLLELTKADVMELENLLAIISDQIIIETGKPKGVPPSLTTIWKVIFAMVTFVAGMSLVFLVIWTVQLRKIRAAEKLQELE